MEEKITETVKLFISQPMADKTNEEIKDEREKALSIVKEVLKTDNIEIIDSVFDCSNRPPLECLGEAIKLMAMADVAYFSKGWNNYRGCIIEHLCALNYDIKIIEYVEDKKD